MGISWPGVDCAMKKESSVKFLYREYRDGSEALTAKSKVSRLSREGPASRPPPAHQSPSSLCHQAQPLFHNGEWSGLGKQCDLSKQSRVVARVSGNREGEREWKRNDEQDSGSGVPYGPDLCPRLAVLETGSAGPPQPAAPQKLAQPCVLPPSVPAPI